MSHRWIRCNADGTTGCVFLHEDNAFTHELTSADVGKVLKLRVRGEALLDLGSREVDSATTPVIAADPPANTVAPSISGTAQDGEQLSGTDGTWTGTPPISFSYQWQRCEPPGFGTCTDIPSATSINYTLTSADVGRQVRLRVRATGPQPPSVDAFSAKTATVAADPPVNNAPPTFTGTAQSGQQLSGSPGTWTGTQPITFAYQWQRCAPPGFGTCTDIPGATGLNHTLTDADVGARVRLRERATGPQGSPVDAFSAQSATVQGAPPVAVAPTFSGTARSGQTLTQTSTDSASGTPPFTFERQWLRCDSSGDNCSEIASADETTYLLTDADVGSTIRLRLTATNDAGSDEAVSTASTVVLAAPPVNNSAPTIPTSARKGGESLTVSSDGTWSGFPPINFSYQWLRCNAGGQSCTPIPGATQATYNLVGADVGSRLRVRVTATNPGGSTPADSNASAVVDPDPPVNTVDPSISGTARDGELLTGDDGDWTAPGGQPQFLRSWQRCATADASSCVDIPGATGMTYQLTSADVGNRVRLVVAAFGAYGLATEASEMTDVVVAVAPANSSAPEVLGVTRRGEELTASPGFWTGTAPLTFGYQWQRCVLPDPASCVDIPGATGPDYTLTGDDVATRIRVGVRAGNAVGTTEPVWSALSDVVLEREAGASLLSPFPRIAIGGRFTRNGARLTLLRIRGEAGATVTVRCRGRGCPFRRARYRMRGRTLRITKLQRRLRAGVVIQIYVAKPGKIGKYTRFKIRGGKLPLRRDACLQPGSSRPSQCPE